MDSYKKILKRANVSDISSFLIEGQGLFEDINLRKKSYEKRITDAMKAVTDGIEGLSTDEERKEKVIDNLMTFFYETEHIMLELGLRSGIMFILDTVRESGTGDICFGGKKEG